jgi:hypothetical protein
MKFFQVILKEGPDKVLLNRLFTKDLWENDLKILFNLFSEEGPLSSAEAFNEFMQTKLALRDFDSDESNNLLLPWRNVMLNNVFPKLAELLGEKEGFLKNLKSKICLIYFRKGITVGGVYKPESDPSQTQTARTYASEIPFIFVPHHRIYFNGAQLDPSRFRMYVDPNKPNELRLSYVFTTPHNFPFPKDPPPSF